MPNHRLSVQKSFFMQKGLLQNESFATVLFLCLGQFIERQKCVLLGKCCRFGRSKADREGSHGLAVDNFSVFIGYATFFSE